MHLKCLNSVYRIEYCPPSFCVQELLESHQLVFCTKRFTNFVKVLFQDFEGLENVVKIRFSLLCFIFI
jgi:hypothetical protein